MCCDIIKNKLVCFFYNTVQTNNRAKGEATELPIFSTQSDSILRTNYPEFSLECSKKKLGLNSSDWLTDFLSSKPTGSESDLTEQWQEIFAIEDIWLTDSEWQCFLLSKTHTDDWFIVDSSVDFQILLSVSVELNAVASFALGPSIEKLQVPHEPSQTETVNTDLILFDPKILHTPLPIIWR